jgi:tctex1 domain-containing protein 2
MDLHSKIETNSKKAVTERETMSYKKINKKKYNLDDYLSKYSSSRKSSIDTLYTGIYRKQMSIVRNTFKLRPDEDKFFCAYKIYPRIEYIMNEKIKPIEQSNAKAYNVTHCLSLTKELADCLRRELKNSLASSRYKVVVYVVVGQNKGQDARIASRCLWNADFDNSLDFSHKSEHFWICCVIFIAYTD